jgi:lipoprotein-anchoring transpeptidase ErfK/SrfK
VYEKPGPGAVPTEEIVAENDWSQRIALPVIGGFTDENGTEWLHVMLPNRPNGSRGWLRGDEVRSEQVSGRIVVDLSAHTLKRLEDGERVSRFSVGVGTAGYPTTPGRFFVWARVPYDPPTGAYGVFALGLSGFSEVITDWVGGGRMAIHGTTDPSDLGKDVSHGCVRVYNPEMEDLMDVPMGTPVLIRP